MDKQFSKLDYLS